MRISLWFAALSLSGLLLTSQSAVAQDGTVAIGGQFLFRIRASAEGKTAEQRADDVTDRLPEILGDSQLSPSDITLVPAKGKTYQILVKRRLLITVTPEDGKANQRTALQQATAWAEQARRALPQINAQPNPNQIAEDTQTLSGTVSYRQRIALPPNATLRLRLLDVSRADAPATTVTQKTVPITGQVPIPFELTYRPETIQPQHTYILDARILVGGRVRWIPAQRTAVITGGKPTQVNILLRPASSRR